MKIIPPIIHDNLAQIFVRHYKMQPKAAAEEALRFMEIIDLYDMQVIVGDWLIPEPVPQAPRDAWSMAIDALKDAEEREPWLAREIQ